MKYSEYITEKLQHVKPSGFHVDALDYDLFPHQIDLTRWALRMGRSAVFADTGLGKTRIQVAWANEVYNHTNGGVLILAPLAVAEQTVAEAADIGVTVHHDRNGEEFRRGLTITNYERLHRFNPAHYVGVVLDESSCIKHHDTKTLARLLDAFKHTPYKLCATATPAPNDWTELGTHAEFLGICSRVEMLSEFFIHDAAKTQDWRLKGHAKELFWRWVSGWGALVKSPADLGHDDTLYQLPPLITSEHTVEYEAEPADGELFALEALQLSDRRKARRESMSERVNACAEKVNSDKQPWVVWCDLNAESEMLTAAIPDAIEVKGADSLEHKEKALHLFATGQARVLVSKPSICGFGMNWQHCARMGFVGVTDSFEAFYQAIRRCWRFGQLREVHVHIFASKQEGAIVANLRRKERDAAEMAAQLSKETHAALIENVQGTRKQSNEYNNAESIQLPAFMRAKKCVA